MGIRESLIVDWENKTIEYQGKRMYIIKQFVYENKEYFYAIDLATVNNKNLEIAFLYKVKDDIFEHVEDEELFDKLVVKAGSECFNEILKHDIEQLQKEGKL